MIVTPLVNTLYKGKLAKAGEPIDAETKWAKSMIKLGKVKEGAPSDFDIAQVDVDLDENTVNQLLKIAEQLEIDVPKGAKKAEIINLIETATQKEGGEGE